MGRDFHFEPAALDELDEAPVDGDEEQLIELDFRLDVHERVTLQRLQDRIRTIVDPVLRGNGQQSERRKSKGTSGETNSTSTSPARL